MKSCKRLGDGKEYSPDPAQSWHEFLCKVSLGKDWFMREIIADSLG